MDFSWIHYDPYFEVLPDKYIQLSLPTRHQAAKGWILNPAYDPEGKEEEEEEEEIVVTTPPPDSSLKILPWDGHTYRRRPSLRGVIRDVMFCRVTFLPGKTTIIDEMLPTLDTHCLINIGKRRDCATLLALLEKSSIFQRRTYSYFQDAEFVEYVVPLSPSPKLPRAPILRRWTQSSGVEVITFPHRTPYLLTKIECGESRTPYRGIVEYKDSQSGKWRVVEDVSKNRILTSSIRWVVEDPAPTEWFIYGSEVLSKQPRWKEEKETSTIQSGMNPDHSIYAVFHPGNPHHHRRSGHTKPCFRRDERRLRKREKQRELRREIISFCACEEDE